MCSGSTPRSRAALDDWLADPLVQLVMKADAVDPGQIRRIFQGLAIRRLAAAAPAGGVLSSAADRSSEFRSGVGIMLLNQHDDVFVGRRTGTEHEAWQMPQGGIDDGEEPLAAAFRELREEIGTGNAKVLAESNIWFRYELPAELIGTAWGGRWRGQQQKWFAMRFLGSDDEISVATEHPEFSAWRWSPIADLPNLIVAFKRQVYLDVLRQFHAVLAAGRLTGETGTMRIAAAAPDPGDHQPG